MEGLRPVSVAESQLTNSYFSSTEVDYVYKAKIDIYGRYFGGILIIKKLGPEKHRVVFTTEFGSKIFDFLFDGELFTQNYILEDLDKRIVVNTLEEDFKLLISENISVEEQFVSDDYKILRVEDGKRYNFYFFTASEGRLKKIIRTSKKKEKVKILFELDENKNISEANEIAKKIMIEHQNIKLTIDLEDIKNN